MTQANRLGAAGVMPGTADASAYAPLRRPVFRARGSPFALVRFATDFALTISPALQCLSTESHCNVASLHAPH
jgi:hypothetical protein